MGIYYSLSMKIYRVKHHMACKDRGCILFVFVSACMVGKNPYIPNWSAMADDSITQGDDIGVLGSPFYIYGFYA